MLKHPVQHSVCRSLLLGLGQEAQAAVSGTAANGVAGLGDGGIPGLGMPATPAGIGGAVPGADVTCC